MSQSRAQGCIEAGIISCIVGLPLGMIWVKYHGVCHFVQSDACCVQVGEDSPSGPGQVQRLLHACEQHGLASSSTVICRTSGAVAWYQGRVGAAAAWMLRARDERRLAAVLEPLVSELREVLRSGVGSYKVRGSPS